jgi:1-deoxy-D-xylulose-5-phosphate synthase
VAAARDLHGDDFKVVAVIGDGSLTSGMAYEALNNGGHTDRDVIVVLNDNEMSISRNVGAIHKYLTRVVTNPLYNRVRDEIKNLLQGSSPTAGGGQTAHAPGTQSGLRAALESFIVKLEESAKNMLVPGTLFEELGFRYFGPVDGHDLDLLLDTFSSVRNMRGPRLVHVLTRKGKGFPLAEQNPVVWHGATPFDKLSGEAAARSAGNPAYTNVFGKGLVELANERPEVVAITAAMPSGTGTGLFADAHPERFFDVGIAEGHGVTFAAGLATEGVRPVVAIYSTFLQRAYDSIIHDVAIQKLPVVFAMDRAGLVGNDGPTHMGLYDIPYMLAVPNMTVTAPKDGAEMLALLRLGVEQQAGPFCLRYPRDSVPAPVPPLAEIAPVEYGTWEVLAEGPELAILAVGTMVHPALHAARILADEGIAATVVNCRFLKPMDDAVLERLLSLPAILTVEEGTIVNGFGAAVARRLAELHGDVPQAHFASIGVPDRIIDHASRGEQLAEVGLTPEAIAERARALARHGLGAPVPGGD